MQSATAMERVVKSANGAPGARRSRAVQRVPAPTFTRLVLAAALAASAVGSDDVTICEAPTDVLITGISGMIGSHLARVLVARRCTRVFGLVRPRSDLSALRGVLRRIELVQGDIADSFRMREVIQRVRPHYVYHFAAQAINGISYAVPSLSIDVNVRGTLNLLEAIREAQAHGWRRHGGWRRKGGAGLNPARNESCRVLLAGSSTEYGHTAALHEGPIPESAPLLPVSPYGVSKVATENWAARTTSRTHTTAYTCTPHVHLLNMCMAWAWHVHRWPPRTWAASTTWRTACRSSSRASSSRWAWAAPTPHTCIPRVHPLMCTARAWHAHRWAWAAPTRWRSTSSASR